jgi:hypothetical protein
VESPAARLLPWLLVAGLFAAAAAMHARTALAAPSAEDAVRLAVEARGDRYAGDCAQTESPRDIGGVCSRLVDEHGGLRAFLIGRTFSEFSRWLFLEETSDGWRLVDEAPLDLADDTGEIPWP